MKIVVLAKQVPDTYGERDLDPTTGRIDRMSADVVIDEICERALEAALAHKDETDTEVVLMTMGPADATTMLRRGLAIGADSAVHIVDDALAGADMLRTSAVLASALEREGFDLVITGNESTDGRGGAMAAMLSERLGLPHATYLNTVEIKGNTVSGERAGEDNTRTIRATLPAIISVTERMPEARFPTFKGSMRAKKKPIKTLTLAELPVPALTAQSVVISTSQRPPRQAGTKIIDDGSAATQLVDFLTSSRLI
ncbi:electron transfer flavoprotein subunit beta/FixA family protein [Pseudarthrobacter sp. NPDC092419]|uniref:electron transfer flavoprotein subunit beta/FixA family protein n=1 Tax=Pseudarthrobacter sp. NPDC092419 TaxID=3364414 RepID=UPI0038308FEE